MSRSTLREVLPLALLTAVVGCLEDETPDASTPARDGSVARADAAPARDATPGEDAIVAPDAPATSPDAEADGGVPPRCDLETDPAALTFGAVELGRRSVLPVRVRNVGGADCAVADYRVTGGGLAVLGSPPAVIAPGQTVVLDLAFDAASAGTTRGELAFGPAGEEQAVSLAATATTSTLHVVPAHVTLESSAVQCPTPRSVLITTDAPGTRITRAEVVGGPASLTVEAGGLPAAVSVDEGFALQLVYTPPVVARDTARLLVYREGVADPTVIGVWASATDAASVTETFPALVARVDVLLVVDHSATMVEEQAALTGAARSVLEGLRGVDYRVGVVSTGLDRRGELVEALGRRWVTAQDADPVAGLTALINAVGAAGSGRESGLEAAYLALSGEARAGRNAGFLRADANVAVVVVSDEEDASPRMSRLYSQAITALKPRQRELSASLSAVVLLASDARGCAGVAATVGARYVEVASETGGSIASVCARDWTTSLGPIVQVAAGRRAQFPLEGTPDRSTVSVWSDGVRVQDGWSYDALSRAVRFEAGRTPDVGARVEIRYAPQCP